MNVFETTASPDLLCTALRDVTGVDFDATIPSEVAAAALLVKKLSESPDVANHLADSLARHSRSAPENNIGSIHPPHHVTLRRVKSPIPREELLPEDFPSEASSKVFFPDLISSAAGGAITLIELKRWDDADSVAQRHHSEYVMYSPQVLGFHANKDPVNWSSDTELKWGKFLQLAETKISSREPEKSHYSMLFSRAWRDLRNKLIYSAEQKAKNYSVVELKAGTGKSTAHFLFEPNNLYVVIIYNDAKTLQSKVQASDIDTFAKEIVDAFGGHKDYAKGALESLRNSLTH